MVEHRENSPGYLLALFPGEEAREMLEIIANSTQEVADFYPEAEVGVHTIRDMLGDYGALVRAEATWNDYVVARIRGSQLAIEGAGPDLAANWSGDAHAAYGAHEQTTLDRIGGAVERARDVAEALRTVRQAVSDQYKSAIQELVTVINGVIGLAGDYGRISAFHGDKIDKAIEFIQSLVSVAEVHLRQVVDTLDSQTNLISETRAAAADLLVPSPASVVAQTIGDPQRWDPR